MAGPDTPEAALADLPDEVADAIRPHLTEDDDTLAAIGVALAQLREEAKTARSSSGIESTWLDAEEAYIGVDDANRHEFNGARWSKPLSMDGPVTTSRTPRNTDHRSTAFVRLTARYVDAGAAKVAEILLPSDDKAFSFTETPLPELIKAKEDTSHVVHQGTGIPLMRPAQPGETPSIATPAGATQQGAPTQGVAQPALGALPALPGMSMPAPAGPGASLAPPQAGAQAAPAPPTGGPAPPGQPQVPLTVRDLALENIEIARKKAKAAETRIYDWLVDCQYRGEMRKVVFDASRIGVGILKAPYPKVTRRIALTKGKQGGSEVEIREDIAPAAGWVDPWNVYPDPGCGENIHDGNYVFECDAMSQRQVRGLKLLPGYIADEIDAALDEGPEKSYLDDTGARLPLEDNRRKKNRFTIWYFYGSFTKEQLEAIDRAAGRTAPQIKGGYREEMYVIATMINDRVVKASVNPLDSGSFPYHSVPWQRRTGHWAGIGVAEQLRMPQRTVNAATRAMLNNAGKSAGSQLVIDRTGIIPADGQWTVVPDKIWFKTGDAVGTDVRQSFMAIEIPNMTDQLMKIIQYGMQLAEEATSIPLVTQGQSGETSPETFGATQLQNTNANQLLRSIGYAFDDFITEPVVRKFYEWLLLDENVPDDEKGDFKINAHGSVALVERAIQDQTIAQMGQMAANPVYGVDPKKWATVFLKSKHLDPADLQYSEEQQQKIDQTPPPEAPAVTAAKIAADAQLKLGVMKQTADQQSQQSEERIAQAAQVLEGGHVQNEAQRVQAEQHRTAVEATVNLHELQTKRELAIADYAHRNQVSLAQAKVALAKTAMTLQTQRQLNAEDNAADARKQQRPERPRRGAQPPGQTPGRAGNGRGFEQGPQQ